MAYMTENAAVEGSAWDIGAAAEDRGAGLANEQSAQEG
jgi:hypothetical protein